MQAAMIVFLVIFAIGSLDFRNIFFLMLIFYGLIFLFANIGGGFLF